MTTYKRVLTYIKPYRKHLSASVLFSIFYALLNTVSVYMLIPLLNTLFREKGALPVESKTITQVGDSPVSNWFSNIGNEITSAFKNFVFSGTEREILLKICKIY